MEQEHILRAMRAMGWNPDSDLPIANEENRALLQDIQDLQNEKLLLHLEQEQLTERVEKLRVHAKTAQESSLNNMKILEVHQNTVRRESNMLKTAQREKEKLASDIKMLTKDVADIKKIVDRTGEEICRRKQKMSKQTERIKWAKCALIEWREAMEAGNKGFQLIERYFKEDIERAREQNKCRQLLDQQIQNVRKKLEHMLNERNTLEGYLDTLANLYRAAHLERRQMVDTWKAAATKMVESEDKIMNGEEELLDLQDDAKDKKHELKCYDDRLNEIISNNREVEAAIEDLNNNTSDLKRQLQKFADMIILKENDIEILQKELQNLMNNVHVQRNGNRQKLRSKIEKLEELKNFKSVLDNLQARLDALNDKKMSAEQRLQVLEDMATTEERIIEKIMMDTSRLNDTMYRLQTQLAELRSEKKMIEVQNSGHKVNTQAVNRNTRELKKEIERLTEIHYNLAFRCLEIERQIIKGQGGAVDPELEQKNLDYLVLLEEQHVQLQKHMQITEAQNKKLDDTMRKLTDVFDRDCVKLKELEFDVKEFQVYVDGSVKRLKQFSTENHKLIVELSILRLRNNEFEEQINETDNKVFNLQKHRAQLIRAIKDRMVELRSQSDLLQMKIKNLNEEKATLRADIGERNKHIDAMRARFDLSSKLLGFNENGTLVTATQIRVELVQEKQILVGQGNSLNDKVLKAENEIKAMENTLQLLHISNNSYRTNTKLLEDNPEAVSELQNLEANYCIALDRVQEARKKVHAICQENNCLADEKEKLEMVLEKYQIYKTNNSEVLDKLKRDLTEQEAKLQRAEREIKLIIKKMKKNGVGEEFLEHFSRDMDLRDLEFRNQNALNMLCDATQEGNEFEMRTLKLLNSKGFKLPHQMARIQSYTSLVTKDTESGSTSSKKDLVSGLEIMTSAPTSARSSITTDVSQTAKMSIVTLDFPEKF